MIHNLPLLPIMIGLPLLASLCTAATRTRSLQICISLLVASMQVFAVVLLVVFWQGADQHHVYRYALGGWGAPLGIDLMVDGISLVMLLITNTIAWFISVYSTRYFSNAAQAARFWPLWWLLITGLNAMFVAGDAFNIYVALEIIGLSSVALIALSEKREALLAALRYAFVGLLGSMLYLLSVIILYRKYGTLDLMHLSTLMQNDPVTWLVLALISVGLMLKIALLPLHFWLPAAHSSAPAPVSAVLSALVVKASFYLLFRFWFDVLAPGVSVTAANLLGALGAAAIIWGCIAAYRAQRLKLLVAYSTVAQLGYLFLIFPLATASGAAAVGATKAVFYFVIAHALAKAAMFLAAGHILMKCGHDEIDKLQNLVRSQPLAVATFAIAGASLIGLPPSSGFIAKWLLLNTAIQNGQWWWVIVLLLGGLLAAAYVFRVLNKVFTDDEAPKDMNSSSSSSFSVTTVSGFLLALGTVALGFNAEWLLALLEQTQ